MVFDASVFELLLSLVCVFSVTHLFNVDYC